jgi:YfiH family protein
MCRRSCAAEAAPRQVTSGDDGNPGPELGRAGAAWPTRALRADKRFGDTGHVSVRIRRVTTTRAGGVSAPPFDTFNLGDHVGDDPAAVAANRARLAAAIGLGADRLVWMNQAHGDRVEVVDEPQRAAVGGGVGTDALVTATPRLALAVVTADCVPVLMADARAGVVAAVHAGRVGAQRGVVVRAVEAMLALGAQAADISVLLGPAVSGRNYEVPAAMADEVEAALPGCRTTTAAGTPGLDLRAGIACQLGDWVSRRSTSTRAARWPTRGCSAIAGARRPGGWRRWSGWSDRCGGGHASPGKRWPPGIGRPGIGIDPRAGCRAIATCRGRRSGGSQCRRN